MVTECNDDNSNTTKTCHEMSLELPSHDQIEYAAPHIPLLLALSGYLFLLSSTSTISGWLTNAPLLGPLLVGILLGPELAGLLSPAIQTALIQIGYIGLILIVFEAGLMTDISLLFANAALSCMAALTGILLPIALSIGLLHGAWEYSAMQAFAAGAALCSTSLGTTLALLTPELRRTKVGSVLMAAALLDDIVGLVIAGIIPELANRDEGGVSWQTIVRPILVSLAFGMGTPLFALISRKLLHKLLLIKVQMNIRPILWDTRMQLFVTVTCLSAFVAGSKYAGTSELFGAYLAGAFLAYVFSDIEKDPENVSSTSRVSSCSLSSPSILPSATRPDLSLQLKELEAEVANPTTLSFSTHLEPILTPLLGPIFFASIGAALPIGSLFTMHSTDRGVSHRVVGRRIVYSILMIIGKMAVGIWMVVWPKPNTKYITNGTFSANDNFGRTSKRNGKLTLDNAHENGESRSDGIDQEDDVLKTLENGSPVVVEGTSDHLSNRRRISNTLSPTVQFRSPTSSPILSTTETTNHALESLGTPPSSEPTRFRSSILLGLAMVARGEIALIVAQLGRPLLVGSGDSSSDDDVDEELFAIVIWAVLLSTLLGALGVGIALGVWERKDRKKELKDRT